MKSRNIFRRRIVWLVILLFLVAGGVLAYFQFNPPPAGPVLATVQRGDLKATVNANGVVRSKQSARLALPVSGIVTRVNVAEGDGVKANAVLVELDHTESQLRVQQAQLILDGRQRDYSRAQAAPAVADLAAAQANLKKAALALAAAQKNYKDTPTSNNSAAQDIAQIDYDQAKANFDRVAAGTSADDLKTLQNNLQAAQLDLQSAQRALDQTRLLAPFDGIVTEVDAHASELVGGFTQMIVLADTTQLEIRASVDEIDVANVAVGQNVDIHFDAVPGQDFSGKVTRLFPAANTDRGSTVYYALIDFDKRDVLIRPGMGATLQIATLEKKGVLYVPARAVKSAGSQKFVALMQNGQRHDVVVEVGVTTGSETEIVSGLNAGDQVVVE